MKLQARRMCTRSLVGVYARAMNRRTKECALYQPSPIFMFRLLSVLGLILPSNSGKKEATTVGTLEGGIWMSHSKLTVGELGDINFINLLVLNPGMSRTGNQVVV
jgi:hypothetical protein